MNYKISTLVLFIFLIISIVYNYKTKPATLKILDANQTEHTLSALDIQDIHDYISFMTNSEELQDKWINTEMDSVERGRFISRDSAIIKMADFTKWNKKLLFNKHKISPYGFGFGLSKMRRLIKAIDRENKKHLNQPDSIIYGVRVNLTRTVSSESKKDYLDAMIVPVLKNNNFYVGLSAKSNLTGDDLLLNTSLPCPKNCGGQ